MTRAPLPAQWSRGDVVLLCLEVSKNTTVEFPASGAVSTKSQPPVFESNRLPPSSAISLLWKVMLPWLV